MKTAAFILAAFCAAAPCASPRAADAQPAVQFDRLERADGAKIVPERFLRSWDPVTVFFSADAGPPGGGAEDKPQRFVKMSPEPVGEWRWLSPRALQFRPAAPWRPLAPIVIETQGAATRLTPLLPEPLSAEPAGGPDPIEELDHIALTFAEPVDVAGLAKLVSVELRPAPGLSGPGQLLGAQDVSITPLERRKPGEGYAYLIQLKQAVADGRVAILRLKLSDEAGLDEPSYELRLTSAPSFAVAEAACGAGFERRRAAGLLQCAQESEEARQRSFTLEFNARPAPPDIFQAREALRITPPLDGLAVEAEGSVLKISGRFLADTVYELNLAKGAFADERRRPLAHGFRQRFAFASEAPHLAFDVRRGVVERFGPQLVPLRGAGYDKVDLRIFAIDPLSRDFWPFPAEGVETEDGREPPLPGAGPQPWAKADAIGGGEIAARIRALGSPAVSELAALPIRRQGAGAKFGLDLRPALARIKGPEQPGAYLVGIRPIGAASRSWMRLQATDLTLTSVEEPERIRFFVTSLAAAKPVEGAEVRIEGLREERYVTLALGRTDAEGAFSWLVGDRAEATIQRIVVVKGLDVLTLDPADAPAEYRREAWTKPDEPWLGWAGDPEAARTDAPRILCHLFTERPIYRPEEPVHIKGYVRRYLGGALSLAPGKGVLVVRGPGGQEWRLPSEIDSGGGVYQKFDAATVATGDYTAVFEPSAAAKETADGQEEAGASAQEEPVSCGETGFKKEAYRLPTFEALLNAPPTATLDAPFSVELLARYFAGGLVADRPVKWRASQFPYVWTPPGREGWFFSTDARFSGDGKFRSTPVLERDAATDGAGAAKISFDPAAEPTAQPRRYQIEATVAGEDGLEVRNVVSVAALPPFVLGIRTPRYQKAPGPVEAEILAVDAKGAPLDGVAMTARLVRRNWSSTLQASDFSQGAAKYVTEVIDETVKEDTLVSAMRPLKLAFAAEAAGVYLVELEALDKSGRRQKVAVDFFVGGDAPTSFARAPSQIAQVSADRDAYAPGETATLIIESPFQTARALAIVEAPSGRFRTQWVAIANGYGRFEVAVETPDLPKLAVHFLIMRGRLPGEGGDPSAPFDQGKPVTIAATKWIAVTPVKNIVTVSLDYPQKARPGQEIEVALRLADDLGRPIAGEATFWMVDQAVLSLAKERPLDPLPSFIVERPSVMAARDTRNMAFGVIPLEETPGGDAGLEEWGSDNNVSVRKNFTPVPIYLPKLIVGSDGLAKIRVLLPDSLSAFKLRAKAVSGAERFGYATGEVLVRQDLVAQPALPRFLRRGDAFAASYFGRIVEGAGGAGRASLELDGLSLNGAGERLFEWERNRPARVDFSVAAALAGPDRARLRFVLRREADAARDAIEVTLPILPDRPVKRERRLVDVAAKGEASLPKLAGGLRPDSLRRSLDVAADPALARLVAGLNFLVAYPYGCTEQRIALASAALALKPFEPVLAASSLGGRLSDDVHTTIVAIKQSVDADGLVAFWPRGRGDVSLTAWAYAFLVAAQRAGEPIDKPLMERLELVLKQALRSDYARLRDGAELRQRVEALTSLAGAGRLDPGYAAELARLAASMPPVAVAQMTQVAAQLPGEGRGVAEVLVADMWSRVKFLMRKGVPVYAGQAADDGDPAILPSEARSLAEMTKAAALAAPQDPRAPALRDALLRLGEGDGWGSTNANAAAVRALAALWRASPAQTKVSATQAGRASEAQLGAETPFARLAVDGPEEIRIVNGGEAPVVALSDVAFLPAEPGHLAKPVEQGFSIARTSYRILEGAPPALIEPDADGALHVASGEIVEERVEIVSPLDRVHVALTIPLAAGFEPLNPALASAPREAAPSFAPTRPPSWMAFGDDSVFYAYDALPKGNYRFAFRVKAMTQGSFTQPPGEAQTMYQAGVYGSSAGRRIIVER